METVEPFTCPICHGTGKLPKFNDGMVMPDAPANICNTCEGKGMIWGPPRIEDTIPEFEFEESETTEGVALRKKLTKNLITEEA